MKFNFKTLLSNGEFTRNVITLVKGTTIAQAIPILISPILTRIYSPSEFGILAIYISLLSILSVISTGKYELAIMLPDDEEEAIQLIWLSFFMSVISSVIIFLLLTLSYHDISHYFGFDGNSDFIIYILPISIVMFGGVQAITMFLNRNKSYVAMSRTKVINNAASGASQMLVYFSTNGLIIGYIIGQLSSFVYISNVIRCKIADGRVSGDFRPNVRFIFSLAFKYRVFPLVNSTSSLLNTSSVQLIPIVLTNIFSSAIAGFYSLAQRILQMPMSLLGSSISQVYFQKAREIFENKDELKRLTIEINKKLLLIGALPIFITLLFGEHIFALIFGEEWKVAGEYARYLAPWIYLVFISSPLSNLIIVMGKQSALLKFNFLLFVSRIGWFAVVYLLNIESSTAIIVHANIGTMAWLAFIFYVMKLAEIDFVVTLKQLFPFALLTSLSYIIGEALVF